MTAVRYSENCESSSRRVSSRLRERVPLSRMVKAMFAKPLTMMSGLSTNSRRSSERASADAVSEMLGRKAILARSTLARCERRLASACTRSGRRTKSSAGTPGMTRGTIIVSNVSSRILKSRTDRFSRIASDARAASSVCTKLRTELRCCSTAISCCKASTSLIRPASKRAWRISDMTIAFSKFCWAVAI